MTECRLTGGGGSSVVGELPERGVEVGDSRGDSRPYLFSDDGNAGDSWRGRSGGHVDRVERDRVAVLLVMVF